MYAAALNTLYSSLHIIPSNLFTMLIRNRRKILSLTLTVVALVVFYFLFKDVELALVSKNIIRNKGVDSSTMAQVAQVPIEDTSSPAHLANKQGANAARPQGVANDVKISDKVRVAGSIMPSMPDQDAKKELGNASWKYFHTLLARFPDEPTTEEREKLKSFIHLYAELYPCGECSYHFVKMIEKYPVQTSSRKNAALWGCDIHNKVNAYLKKDIYDCSTILEDYDCGCGDDKDATL